MLCLKQELRQLTRDDAAQFITLVDANRNFLRQWLPWVDSHRDITASGRFIADADNLFQQQHSFHLGLFTEDHLAGVMSIHHLDWRNRKAALGYWIGEAYQGQGLVTDACRTLLQFCYEDLDLNRLEIHCAVNNHNSKKIPERLGFELEGVLKQVEWLYDHWVDHKLYSLLRDEWSQH